MARRHDFADLPKRPEETAMPGTPSSGEIGLVATPRGNMAF